MGVTMDDSTISSIYQGTWIYRSFNNAADLDASFDSLEFGVGTLRIDNPSGNVMSGTIGGPGWQLELQGSVSYGDPGKVWFTGRGVVAGEKWQYSYMGYFAPRWPTGISQRAALVGTIVRDIPHASGKGGIAPAGVVASWIAVAQDPAE